MASATAALVAVSLLSFAFWIGRVRAGSVAAAVCAVLSLRMSILAALTTIAAVVAVVLWLIGCAAGGFVDVACFGTLLSIASGAGAGSQASLRPGGAVGIETGGAP